MFWSKLCKSTWNCACNLAFPLFISPVVWNMCENLPHESVYFKELHNQQECYWLTIYRAGAAVVSTITSLFSFTLTAACSRYVFRLPVTGSRELRNLVFFLGFFEDSRSLLHSSIDSWSAFSTSFLLLFLGLEHEISLPIGAASEQLSTMGTMSSNSRYGSIHRGYILLFFGFRQHWPFYT